MAIRPIFVPRTDGTIGVIEKAIDFKWHPGMAKTQKQKSISELHNSAKLSGINNILEISSKSQDELGILLSAFNLSFVTKKHNNKITVESAFQGSKVFKRGGPYKDLYLADSKTSKKDIRIKESGQLVGFSFFNQEFPLIPRTYFYDWLYIKALVSNPKLVDLLYKFEGFSDIEFNPKKSINCQAHAAALFVSLNSAGVLEDALSSPDMFLRITKQHYDNQTRVIQVQDSLI
ncbi:DarT1-associated NADAR antitoxin family protein [Vibrio alginolyticus]|uniref:DarT1-associated NADAR antitoxin family protein n=1 Tax=Vibrio alginolyticus TaxID=663 RepID=UPI003D0EAF69